MKLNPVTSDFHYDGEIPKGRHRVEKLAYKLFLVHNQAIRN
jgi:hypothetical protein